MGHQRRLHRVRVHIRQQAQVELGLAEIRRQVHHRAAVHGADGGLRRAQQGMIRCAEGKAAQADQRLQQALDGALAAVAAGC